MADIQARLKTKKLAGLSWREQSLAPGLLVGVLGRRRDCVCIHHAKFTEVAVLAGAHDHGSDLFVFWIAAATPQLFGRIRRILRFGLGSERQYELGSELDLVQAWSLGAFLETTRTAVRGSIQDLLKERGLPGRKPRRWL